MREQRRRLLRAGAGRFFLRLPLSNTFMLIGFAVSFLGLFQGLNQYEALQQRLLEKGEFMYASQMELMYEGAPGMKLEEVVEGLECNVVLQCFLVYLNDSQTNYIAEIVLNRSEKDIYPLSQGRYPTKEERSRGEKRVAVGRSIYEMAKDSPGGKILQVNGEEYLVTGVFGGESDILADKIYFDYECLAQKEQQSIGQLVSGRLLLGSMGKNVGAEYEKMAEKAPDVRLYRESLSGMGGVSSDESLTFYGMIYLFALINCGIIARYWIDERKQEIAVRKTYGMSNAMIVKYYYRELLGLMAVAWGVCFLLMLFINVLGGHALMLGITDLCLIVAILLASSAVVLIAPMRKIVKQPPSYLVQNSYDY